MLTLYPEIKPYARYKMPVDAIHELYVDESGNKDGIPVIFVHGGPGTGCDFDSRRYFNPARYRIVLIDQRGAGRSTPSGSLQNNTLPDLVEDLLKLQRFLGIEKSLVFAGGFGSTVALAFAIKFPQRMLGLILKGIFLGRQTDIDWIYRLGASQFFPDAWRDFIAPLPDGFKEDPCLGYSQLMRSSNELERTAAAKAWSLWEARCSNLRTHQRLIDYYSAPQRALLKCIIGTHYMVNGCFLSPNELLLNIHALKEIPGILVQGRFDVLTPMVNAQLLSERWPNSELMVVREAGHGANDSAMIDALIRATTTFAERLEPRLGIRS